MVNYLRYQNSNDWIPSSCMLGHLIISVSLKAKMFTLQIRNVEFSKISSKISSKHLDCRFFFCENGVIFFWETTYEKFLSCL